MGEQLQYASALHMKGSVAVVVIHPNKGWIGDSPNGRVRNLHKIIEVKCPYSK
jgi:hypothetical protein